MILTTKPLKIDSKKPSSLSLDKLWHNAKPKPIHWLENSLANKEGEKIKKKYSNKL